MFFTIASDIPGRLRLRCGAQVIDDDEARGVSVALLQVDGVRHAEAHPANGSILVTFSPDARQAVLDAMRALDVCALPRLEESDLAIPIEVQTAMEDNRFHMEVAGIVGWHVARALILPAPLAVAYTVFRAVGFVTRGLKQLFSHGLTVEVLDATAVVASIARGCLSDASTVMMLITLSDAMQAHVERRVRLALGQGLVTRPEKVWAVVDGEDVATPIDRVERGMELHLLAGSVLPVDGEVTLGEGELDESSMTGESRRVHKGPGSMVYAGTALEDGDLRVRVTTPPGRARIDQIVDMVQGSSDLKAGAQSKAEHLADSLVPYSYLAFFAIWGITGQIAKAMVVLMVDYSCAIRLSTPIAVMSAMNEAYANDIVVKGGKYLEALADADTIVFDKTGTLTHAKPTLERVIAFNGADEDEALTYAACIEEHFPHSMARAIVDGARRRDLNHEHELHASVNYVVAHGIDTMVGGRPVCIGSYHLVFEDEGVEAPEGLEELVEREAPTASVIYMAVSKVLTAAFCISDPVRPEAAKVIRALRGLGIEKVVMLTGDSEASARAVAESLGLDSYHAQVLPEHKSDYVQRLRKGGHKAIMVGDGINDSPALAAADVSVAMSDASDIARVVADVSVLDSTLESLVTMRQVSQRTMERIHAGYRFIVTFNSALIALGVAGALTISTAAYLHNLSTFAIAAANTRPYLKK